MLSLSKPSNRLRQTIPGTDDKYKALPSWLEPFREELTLFVRWFDDADWDASDPMWQRVHIRLKNTGTERRIVMVTLAGHKALENRSRLDRVKRKRFWAVVAEWQGLLRGELEKSDRIKQRNVYCVKNLG